MSTVKLDGVLVKEVSRSFYLTLRMLPKRVRGVISLGYLLARASDTIADTTSIHVEKRLRCLKKFQENLLGRSVSPELQRMLDAEFSDQKHHGERVLMAQLNAVITAVEGFSGEEQKLLDDVVKTIITGQLWDLAYFRGERVQVESAADLERYTYEVAGCVGEFWTNVILLHGLAPIDERAELMRLGVNYGKGLQLTNIIRDIPEDYAHGRIYIPGVNPNLEDVIAGSDALMEKAGAYLQDGIEYGKKLPRGKLRASTILPATLGLKTLSLLRETPVKDRVKRRVKVSRTVVLTELLKGFIA